MSINFTQILPNGIEIVSNDQDHMEGQSTLGNDCTNKRKQLDESYGQ